MEKSGGKFFLEWETHSKQISKGLCMMMERQCLVDIAVCCGSNTLHAHKCVLAAGSGYFKEHLENKAIEQVVINGLDFTVIKALIEFMYCGECVFGEDYLKHFIAAVRFFKIPSLENVFAESEYQNVAADEVCIPAPQFICKPPKYPTVYKPFSNSAIPPKINYALNNAYNPQKFKRKCLGSEAEKACAKEAQASRIALANLRKAMATTPQVHSFLVEESFNETTVENFIPSVEENYVENMNEKSVSMIPVTLSNNAQGITADKIKHILGNENVEIMFQTSDGAFVNVSDDVLLNLSKDTSLQYQMVDENGQIGEVHELKTLENETNDKVQAMDTFQAGKSEEIVKSAKIPEEYIDTNFTSTVCNKTNLDTLQFNEDLYGNGFHIQHSEIFEPENLSMQSDLMADHSLEFDDLKYKFLPSNLKHGAQDFGETGHNSSINENEVLEMDTESSSSVQNKSLKFTPDMFFADPPYTANNKEKENIMESEIA